MKREDIENNVGYWQEKANLEYIRQRQEHGVNDPYMITEIDEAFDAGYDKGYQYAVEKACEWLRAHLGAPAGIPQAKSYNDAINELTTEFRKGMEE